MNFSIAGNSAYVLGAILDTDVGKEKIFRLFADPLKLDHRKYILPNLTAIMESDDSKAAINASGTLAVLVRHIYCSLCKPIISFIYSVSYIYYIYD